MRKTSASLVLIALLSLGGLLLGSPSAYALCVTPAEEGDWKNYDPDTRSITKVHIRFQCQDVIVNGKPYPPGYPFYLHLYGKCHPTDCGWGKAGATEDSSGWLRTTIHHGFATRYVWAKAYTGYPQEWLRVYIWTDFRDPGREDYASDDWFIRP